MGAPENTKYKIAACLTSYVKKKNARTTYDIFIFFLHDFATPSRHILASI